MGYGHRGPLKSLLMGFMAGIGKHLRGNAVAYVAVFLALTAGAYAVTKAPKNSVVSKSIKNGQVKTKDLRDKAVKTKKLADGAVTDPKLAAGAVTTGKLANGAVTAEKIGPPEPWHEVGPASTTQDLCVDPTNVAVFCSVNDGGSFRPWENYGLGFATAAFYKDQLGIVHLKGLVSYSYVSFIESFAPEVHPIFRLPAGYRPERTRIFASEGDGLPGLNVAPGRVDVTADGLVYLVSDCDLEDPSGVGEQEFECSANGDHFTLEGITFRPDE